MSRRHDTTDLEELRTEMEQLGSQITRTSLILIGTLIVITLTITNALEKVDMRDLKKAVDLAQFKSQASFDAYSESRSNDRLLGATSTQQTEPLRASWQKANDEYKQIKQKYDQVLQESFSIRPTIFGSGLSIDLRSWIYGVPFITLIGLLYVAVLRKKQKTLHVLGQNLLAAQDSQRKIDRLVFSTSSPFGETAYFRNPAQLEKMIYLAIVLVLLTLVISELSGADVVLLGLSLTETLQYLLMFLTIAFYLLTYYLYILSSLNDQTELLTGQPIKPNSLVTLWQRLQARLTKLISKLRPRISLTTASMLIITSLFLSTSTSCRIEGIEGEVQRFPGYQLFYGSERALWISSAIPGKRYGLYWQDSINNLGRFAYFIGVVLSVVSLMIVIGSTIVPQVLGAKRLIAALFIISSTLSLNVVVDFSFSAFWFKDELFLISNLLWIVPSFFIARMVLSKRSWKSFTELRFVLGLLIFPLVINATLYVGYVVGKLFFGVMTYFVGINLLTLTYFRLMSRPKNTSSRYVGAK